MTKKSVLLLEDDFLVAEAIKLDLEALGLHVLGPAFNCAAALEILLHERPDFAILDTHVGNQTCEVVMDECAAQAVPVVIASGHGASELPTFAFGFPLLSKPYLSEQLNDLVQMVQRPLNDTPAPAP